MRDLERWMVIANCQTQGLSNCLQLLNPGVTVEASDIWHFQSQATRDPAHWAAHMMSYDCILLSDEITALGLVDFSACPRVVRIPPIGFAGYHPDLCYVYAEGKGVQTPLDDYHSIVAFAAFKMGLTEADAVALYNARMFEAGGYLDMWAIDKGHLFAHFDRYGYDMAAPFRQWAMRESFMFTLNHPRIECLYDLARVATTKAGRTPVDSPARPHDNLRNAQIFPVYPEIAEACGVEGSTLFKVAGQYRLLSLQEFVHASFEAYRGYGADVLDTTEQFKGRYNAIVAAI